MSRVRGGLGVALALATIAAFSIPAVASSAATLPDVAVGGVSHRAVCTPGPAGTARCHAHVVTGADGVTPRASSSYPTGAYGPAQLQGAYGLPSATAGTGQTVAIVDAYAEPNVVSDVNKYRLGVGLPLICTSAVTSGCVAHFTVSGQSATAPLPSGNTGWGQEIALDVEMVSAICPKCNILLVEANSNYYSDLGAAVNYAKGQANVVAISNSYGGGEFSAETSYDSAYYNTSVANQVITVSSGDSGYGVEYPAASRNVIAVGGTSLQVTSVSGGAFAYGSETAWSGA